MKTVLNSAKIQYDIRFSNGSYWMSLDDVYIDIAEFDSIVSSDIVVTEVTIAKYEQALSLCKGGYLEGNAYIWSLPEKELYSKKCCKLATSLINYYMKISDYTTAERILKVILERSPFEESAHEMLLKLYLLKKDRVAFFTYYNSISELFKNELGLELSDSIQALYTDML